MMTGGHLLVAVVVQTLATGLLFYVGMWGWERAEVLPPAHMTPEDRAHRTMVMRRGSIACIVVGWIMAASVVFVVVDAWDLL